MRFRPLGGSMASFLRSGDIVNICPGESCRVGDVVLWQAGDALILHRVVAKKNGRIITKGDSLGHLDAPVTLKHILGGAVARERQGKVRRFGLFRGPVLGAGLVPDILDSGAGIIPGLSSACS